MDDAEILQRSLVLEVCLGIASPRPLSFECSENLKTVDDDFLLLIKISTMYLLASRNTGVHVRQYGGLVRSFALNST
jgi:hypothetical protein